MKYIFELIVATVVLFFVWNILKKIFFNAFYKNFPAFNPKNQQPKEQSSSKNSSSKQKVKWDAETVDFEEIKEDDKP